MKSSLKIYFLIFIFFIFSSYNNKYNEQNSSLFFPIKEVLIENNVATDLLKLKTDLAFLNNANLLFLKEERIITVINNYDFISNIQLKKKYPNTLKIIIIEKIPVAKQIIDKKKFYITKKNEKINFIRLKIYENIPIIFGRYKNFNYFYNDLEKSNFIINEIKAFYYFDIGRWDIVLKNGKTIKLPEKNYLELFPRINLMLNDSNFRKYTIFDFRVKDQLILQ
ncbi:FtsQ-type POTRA domain-containing protein [Pelagibacteraceae bacterium]|nr:FtsQ-type POTRA domain-containing protein [Pelagibacteraceae bacterium]